MTNLMAVVRRAGRLGACIATALASGTCVSATFNDVYGAGLVDPARNRIYVSTSFAHLYVIDGVTLQRRALAPPSAGSLSINVAANKIYLWNEFETFPELPRPQNPGELVELDPDSGATRSLRLPCGPHRVALNAQTNRIYVADSLDGKVCVVDAASLSLLAVIPVGASPLGIAVNPATNRIYVAGSPVYIIEGATNAATPLPVSATGQVAVDPGTDKAYILPSLGTMAASMLAIDGASRTTSMVSTPWPPLSIEVNPATHEVYVASDWSGGTLSIYDGATLAQTNIATGACCTIGVNVAAGKIYVAPGSRGTAIATVDVATHALSSIGIAAADIAVDPINNRLYTWTLYQTGWDAVTIPPPAGASSGKPTTSIARFPGDTTASPVPRFVFGTGPGYGDLSAQAVYYQVDGGPWKAATAIAPVAAFDGHSDPLRPGVHVVRAFAIDANSARHYGVRTPWVGPIQSYTFTVDGTCTHATCADLHLTGTSPAAGFTGKDVVFRYKVTNYGPRAATDVILDAQLAVPQDQLIWQSSGCAVTGRTVNCKLGTLAVGASAEATVVTRPMTETLDTTNTFVHANELDPDTSTNAYFPTVPVFASPAANIVPRYRLYSPVSLEHHYTMDANEYAVLGASGAWVQEGQVGSVLDNPGSLNGVQAVPYYRLYNTSVRWHHWTTDPNEYYTLMTFPGWGGEDVAGYIFLSQAPGTTQLYRLTYPFIGGLHHWTIDANEYNTLISQYGWVGEGGSGFVIH